MQKQKVALITGASSGIGKEIAKLLLHKGYFVILSGRNENGFKTFANNKNVAIVSGDITKKEVRDALTAYSDKIGRLDVLINNAGLTYIQPFESNTQEQLDTIFETNIKAPMILTQQLYGTMKHQQTGTIVFVNSAAGKQGYPNHTMYSATKFALNGFAQSLRQEAKKHSIRVISVHPGGVKTNLYNTLPDKPDTSSYMDPTKVADVIVNLVETVDISPDEISISRMSK